MGRNVSIWALCDLIQTQFGLSAQMLPNEPMAPVIGHSNIRSVKQLVESWTVPDLLPATATATAAAAAAHNPQPSSGFGIADVNRHPQGDVIRGADRRRRRLPDEFSDQMNASTSAVVRARYEPDVRGVNRYKHFHRPLIVDSAAAARQLPPLQQRYARDLPRRTNDSLSIDSKPNIPSPTRSIRRPTKDFTSNDHPSNGFALPPVAAQNHQTKKAASKAEKFTPVIVVKGEKAPRRARSMHSMRPRQITPLNEERPKSSHRLPPVPNRDSGTQTDDSLANTPSILLPGALPFTPRFNDIIPKATQTNSFSVLSTETIRNIEERTELLEIIDNALDETIDKHSRQRANQFIASSARKQAEAWRDAKDFVSKVLIPQSVTMANRSRGPPKSPLESIASIQLP